MGPAYGQLGHDRGQVCGRLGLHMGQAYGKLEHDMGQACEQLVHDKERGGIQGQVCKPEQVCKLELGDKVEQVCVLVKLGKMGRDGRGQGGQEHEPVHGRQHHIFLQHTDCVRPVGRRGAAHVP